MKRLLLGTCFAMLRSSLFLLMLFFCLSGARAQVTEADSLALVAFYNAANGTGWFNDTNWLSDKPVDSWHGVVVQDGRVTELNLDNNMLSGTISESLTALTGLEYIGFSSNALTGELPAQLGNLTELGAMDIQVNQLTGTLPTSLAQCTKLTRIAAYRNAFSGAFPSVLLQMPALTNVDIGENEFSGALPAGISQMTNLVIFGIQENAFSGPVPSLKNLTALNSLYIYDNDLTGELSDFLGYMPSLYYFRCGANHFTGCVPDSLFNPQRLQFFDFWDNEFTCLANFNTFASQGVLKRLTAHDNHFPFEDLIPNRYLAQFYPDPQKTLLDTATVTLEEGDTVRIYSGSMGDGTVYMWYKNEKLIPGADSAWLEIVGYSEADHGVYTCTMTNSALPNLTLSRSPVTLLTEGTSGTSALQVLPLDLYPNPATSFVRVGQDHGILDIEIRNMMGQCILKRQMHDTSLDVSFLPQGTYILHAVSQDRKTYRAKLIVLR